MGIAMANYQNVLDELEVGETARVNHDNCPAGEDVRRRLYLTRTTANPEAVVGYCHNCQEGGYKKDGGFTTYRNNRHQIPTPNQSIVTDALVVPAHILWNMQDWPTNALAWAYRGYLDQTLVSGYGLGYDPSTDRVYIPRFNWIVNRKRGTLQGYQLRNVEPHTDRCKYLTTCSSVDTGYTELCLTNQVSGPSVQKITVIVEDYLSGIHVNEAFAGEPEEVTVLVNYGTKIQLGLLAEAAAARNVLVWLDNDSEHVKNQADHMSRTIRLINGSCNSHTELEQTDPKAHVWSNIRDYVRNNPWDC